LDKGIFPSENTAEHREEIKTRLKSDKFKECYNKCKSIREKSKNRQIKWYELCSDYTSLFCIANQLKLQGIYKLIYSPLSEKIHGTNNDFIETIPDLRKVNKNIHQIANISLRIILESMSRILYKYPYINKNDAYAEDFKNWHLQLEPILKEHFHINLKYENEN
jgi:hypothetical protein